MKCIYLLISVVFLSGCGFNGVLIKENGEKVEWKANRPCSIKDGDFEVDGKGQPLINIKLPDAVGAKIGG